MFFAEIVILWSADAFESFTHDVPDTTSFSLSWSGGREIECEYGADIDRRTTGLHSSSVTPDQSHHHHPFHTPSPLCSCPSLCLSGLRSGSNAIGLWQTECGEPAPMPPSGSEQVGWEILWHERRVRVAGDMSATYRPPPISKEASPSSAADIVGLAVAPEEIELLRKAVVSTRPTSEGGGSGREKPSEA